MLAPEYCKQQGSTGPIEYNGLESFSLSLIDWIDHNLLGSLFEGIFTTLKSID